MNTDKNFSHCSRGLVFTSQAIAAFIAAVFLVFPVFAEEAKFALPEAVMNEIRNLELECRENPQDGKPLQTKPDIVESADLNGDGLQDYIFYDDAVECELGASLRHGNGGTGVLVFAGTQDDAAKAFSLTTRGGYKLEKKGASGIAWITVTGGHCGQEKFESRSEAILCDRPLIWDEKMKRFEFAPMSETRFEPQSKEPK